MLGLRLVDQARDSAVLLLRLAFSSTHPLDGTIGEYRSYLERSSERPDVLAQSAEKTVILVFEPGDGALGDVHLLGDGNLGLLPSEYPCIPVLRI